MCKAFLQGHSILDLVCPGKWGLRSGSAFIKVTPVTFINEMRRGGWARERGRAAIKTRSEN